MSLLDELVKTIDGLTPEQQDELSRSEFESRPALAWCPNPGPQTEAYFSKANLLLFGGEPGGGKSALLLGLAFNCHQRSLIMRRQYTDLSGIIEEALKLNGGRNGYNGSPPPQLRRSDGRIIDFSAAARLGDEQHWQGIPHDLIGFDEGTQFLETQIRFLMGWLRSGEKGQHKRVVIASNPPLSSDGLWVTEMFAPWLNPNHPNPAKPGELRYFVTDAAGKDFEVPNENEVMVNGKLVKPLSRTFIPSSLKDNPYLINTGYQAQLDSMPEPFRSMLMGGFRNTFRDAANQVIPTDWIRQAQKRWTPFPPPHTPMCAMGVDVAQGGEDDTVLAPRFDGYYPPLTVIPGKQTPLGKDVAGVVVAHRRDNAVIVVDLGGGYGTSAYEHLDQNGVEVVGFKGAHESTKRTHDGKLKFYNRRAEVYWRFREALDPGQPNGSMIMLPDDPKLVAELTAPVLDMSFNGIKIESKEKLVKRLGWSPDRADAVVMAWSAGLTYITDSVERERQKKQQAIRIRGQMPQVVMGRQNAARRR